MHTPLLCLVGVWYMFLNMTQLLALDYLVFEHIKTMNVIDMVQLLACFASLIPMKVTNKKLFRGRSLWRIGGPVRTNFCFAGLSTFIQAIGYYQYALSII